MGRSETKQANADAAAAQKESAAQAREALTNTEAGVSRYNQLLDQELASHPYKTGGQYEQTFNTQFAANSAGGQDSLEDYYRNLASRTGTVTTPQMVSAADEAIRHSMKPRWKRTGSTRKTSCNSGASMRRGCRRMCTPAFTARRPAEGTRRWVLRRRRLRSRASGIRWPGAW